MTAHAWLEKHVFSAFTYQGSNVPEYSDTRAIHDSLLQEAHTLFQLDLQTLLECMNIFGGANVASSWQRDRREREGTTFGRDGNWRNEEASHVSSGNVTTCRITYKGSGHPLVLLLEEAGVITSCELTTYEPDPPSRMGFDDDRRVQKIIMKSEWLKDALLDVDSTSTKVSFLTYPPQSASTVPTFRLCTNSLMGTSEMQFPSDRDVLDTFQCNALKDNVKLPNNKPVLQWSYRSNHMLHTVRGLAASIKVSLRIDDQGLMSMQAMIPSGGDQYSFVEYLIAPLVEEDADDRGSATDNDTDENNDDDEYAMSP